MAAYANIIIDISHEKLDKTFQYKIPEELQDVVVPGVQVQVPFGRGSRLICGYVIEVTEEAEFEIEKIKNIHSINTNGVPVEASLIALASWMHKNYGGTMNQALKMVLPVHRKQKEKEKRQIVLKVPREEAKKYRQQFQKRHSTARIRLLDALLEKDTMPYEVAMGKLHITTPVIRALEEMGILQVQSFQIYRNPFSDLQVEKKHFVLNEQQRMAVDTVLENINRGMERTYLLYGVTGSGKTAVYIELIRSVIARGRQAVVLIPEISLTYQMVMRFYSYFGKRVSILNSKMSAGERYDQFLRAERGEVDVMIGPRSCLFTPFSNLGIIIIDEEHESSYKNETVPRYHARETAIEYAKMHDASVVLGSATPSVESYEKAQKGEYQLLKLSQRVHKQQLPDCEIIDLREELKKANRSILSMRLQELIEERLQRKEQIILFLNRRGLSGFVSCRECGHVFQCPHCDVSLSRHNNGKMVCHYCGYEEPVVNICPACGSHFVSGFKAGTQKIEQEVKKLFPTARILRMDFDTTRKKEGHEEIVSAFANQEADILIGTQMIVKGHDFPNVTLVGILAADMSLHMNDYRSAERTFQLVTQAAGRAGRGRKKGEVLIQTYSPQHYSITLAAKQDYEEFFKQEMEYRKLLRYPPVWNMLVLFLASRSEEDAIACAELLAKKVKQLQENGKVTGLSLIGPADAGIGRINDIYKKVVYFKHEDYGILVRIKDALEAYIKKYNISAREMEQFDFNPMSSL